MRQYYRVKRGMVFWYEPTKAEGKTCVQQGRRPWLVVSNDDGNISAPTCNIVPTTTEDKTHIPVHVDTWFNGQKNTILCEQGITVDQNRLQEFICVMTDETMRKVDEALVIQYGISPVVRYIDINMSNMMEKLEGLIGEIIQQKVKQSTQTVPVSQIEDSALKLGQMIEDLVGESKPLTKPVMSEVPMQPKQVTKPSAPVHAAGQAIKKSGTHTKTKWTVEKRCEFLRDCDEMPMNKVAEKWNLSIKSVFSTKYNCKNLLEQMGVNYKDGEKSTTTGKASSGN